MRLNRTNFLFMLCGAAISLCGFRNTEAQVNDPPPVPLKPSQEYLSFLDKYADTIKVDPFYFFKNYMELEGKPIMFDAAFEKKISPTDIYVKIWRNFGTMLLEVTDIPEDKTIQKNQPLLITGLLYDHKNVVIDGKLESIAIVKFMGKYTCKDFRCNQ
jgi:hypothetical protein